MNKKCTAIFTVILCCGIFASGIIGCRDKPARDKEEGGSNLSGAPDRTLTFPSLCDESVSAKIFLRDFEVSPSPFSPLGCKPTANLSATYCIKPVDSLRTDREANPPSKPDIVLAYRWEIVTSTGEIIRKIEGAVPIPSIPPGGGNIDPQPRIPVHIKGAWDGRDTDGLLLSSGTYTSRLWAAVAKINKPGKPIVLEETENFLGDVILDIDPPFIAITSPSPYSSTRQEEIEIKGSITNGIRVTSATLSSPMAETFLSLDPEGNFSQLIPLTTTTYSDVVPNLITVTAVDAACNVTSSTLRVDFVHPYVQGVVMVAFWRQMSPEDIEELCPDIGATVLDQIEELNLFILQLPEGISVEEAIECFNRQYDVDYVEPDFIYEMQDTQPNDQIWAWYELKRALEGRKTAYGIIDLYKAWDYTQGSTDIKVAVIDSGVDPNHPDLKDNLLFNIRPKLLYCRGCSSTPEDPKDLRGHGTAVAGIIGAVGNNGIGVAGVNWRVKILSYNCGIGDTEEMDGYCVIDAILKAIVPNGAKIINQSAGREDNPEKGIWARESEAERRAIQRAEGRGVLFVTSAGNNQIDLDIWNDFPAKYGALYGLSNMVVVGGSEEYDYNMYNYSPQFVDLAAPGQDKLFATTFPDYSVGLDIGRRDIRFDYNHMSALYSYANFGGTSAAAPLVSGVAALIWARDPTLSYGEVKQIILESVRPVPALSGLVRTGGVLNAFNAMKPGRKLYVANQGSDDVSVIGTRYNEELKRIPGVTVGRDSSSPLITIALSPDNTKAFIAGGNSNSVHVLDTSTDTLVNTWNLSPCRPSGVAASPKHNILFVTCSGGINEIWVIDRSTGGILGKIPTGPHPTGIETSSTGLIVAASNLYGNTVKVFWDGLHLPPDPKYCEAGNFPVQSYPFAVDYSTGLPVISQLWGNIVTRIYGTIFVLDCPFFVMAVQNPYIVLDTNAQVTNLAHHPNSWTVFFTSQDDRVIVASTTTDVFKQGKQIASFPSGGDNPLAIKFRSDGEYMYIANFGSDNVAVFQGYTLKKIIPVGSGPAALGIQRTILW